MTQSAGANPGHLPPFESEIKDWRPGGTLEFADFVDLRGGTNGRVCVDYYVVHVTGTITVADANYDGRDVCRLLSRIAVESRDGRKRWNLSGFKSRLASIKYNGIENHEEHANIAIGAAATVDYRLIIPMTKRFARRPKDFAQPADVFRKIVIECNSYAGATSGSTTLSAADLDVFITAEWHEEDIDSVEIKSEDYVSSVDFTSNTQAKLLPTGAVHDLDIVRETSTAGGGLITGITNVRCDALGTGTRSRSVLKHSYTARRGYAPSGQSATGVERFKEPVRDGQMLPIVTATPETSVWDGALVDQLKVDLGAGAADLSLISREILKKSGENFASQAALFGLSEAEMRMKTAGKTQRSFSEHRDARRVSVAPWSAKVPAARQRG
jgi:hypothetical protein